MAKILKSDKVLSDFERNKVNKVMEFLSNTKFFTPLILSDQRRKEYIDCGVYTKFFTRLM